MSAKEFLNLYRRVEELLEERYRSNNGIEGNVIMRFMKERQGARYREEMNLCREVRNILSHHSDIEGESVVTPAPALVQTLKKLVEELEAPPKALEYATRGNDVLTATMETPVLPLMQQMKDKGLSHVPILKGEHLKGVFSVSTVFSFRLSNPTADITEKTLVRDFAELLPVEMHGEQIKYANVRLTYWEAREAFSRIQKHKRLAVILLTDTGKPDGRLRGVLTPWDVLNEE